MKNWVLDKRQEDRVELRRGGGESLRPHLLPYPVFPIHKSGLGGGGWVLPYMAYTGTCHWSRYGFWWPLFPELGI